MAKSIIRLTEQKYIWKIAHAISFGATDVFSSYLTVDATDICLNPADFMCLHISQIGAFVTAYLAAYKAWLVNNALMPRYVTLNPWQSQRLL